MQDYRIKIYPLKIVRSTAGQDGSTSAVICDGVLPMELRYVRTGKRPPESQFGAGRRPVGDVFGDWYTEYWGIADEPERDRDACQDLRSTFVSTQEQTRPIPGWPGAA
ncbi:hypothetical protein C5E45_21440 [Nocardia nova]|uniref:Uncharacterized protein n=1 Tax=Nocardia nova TaxID=37330 RepID=A0A2S6AM28_9NOCA|nr:hypothetical protein [Nocardia nova]PPJ32638.1 hypothetical protein C5E41_05930 [Nocardia nova]PPJ36280.1 hypothetical protein C5E45_21440 [Nocardia nova]